MGNNTYVFRVAFLDEEDYLLDKEVFTIDADSREGAEQLVEEEISENLEMYPSDNYEIQFLDTY
jgi:hypothetical protein